MTTIDDWTNGEWSNGVQIDQLGALESLFVRTRHTIYEIVITSPEAGDVLVRGGARFPTFTQARVSGCTTGGNLLKCCGIYPGLRIEFQQKTRRVLTSTVLAIAVAADASEHEH